MQFKKRPQFRQMYLLDEQNRTAILEAIEKRIAEFSKTVLQAEIEDSIGIEVKTILFLEVLRPMNGSLKETLQFIMGKLRKLILNSTSFPVL
jgi:hypothetical protein